MQKINLILDYDSTIVDSIQCACDYYCKIYHKHPEFKVRAKKGYFAPKSPSFSTVSKEG